MPQTQCIAVLELLLASQGHQLTLSVEKETEDGEVCEYKYTYMVNMITVNPVYNGHGGDWRKESAYYVFNAGQLLMDLR